MRFRIVGGHGPHNELFAVLGQLQRLRDSCIRDQIGDAELLRLDMRNTVRADSNEEEDEEDVRMVDMIVIGSRQAFERTRTIS